MLFLLLAVFFLLLLLLLWLLLINLFVLRVNRAVGIKSGPSLTEHVHPDLAPSAKLVRRSKLNFLLQSKARPWWSIEIKRDGKERKEKNRMWSECSWDVSETWNKERETGNGEMKHGNSIFVTHSVLCSYFSFFPFPVLVPIFLFLVLVTFFVNA